jgi:TrmH family RNA methyltransferase
MITSFRNPLVKRIKRLRQKKYRQREGAFFIEGLRVVLAAVESGAPIEIIVYSPELLTSDFARQVVADQVAAGMAVETVSGPVFAAVSERENPAGLGAIVRPSTWELAALPIAPESLYLALVEASDPRRGRSVGPSARRAGRGSLSPNGRQSQHGDPVHRARGSRRRSRCPARLGPRR